ncbi:MAG: choice-of-anchor J domain-containing protein [Muribaculaceae bacterium]|nr:choice-of-anchor J domain-containing protein [Muribaculaceae bacterium]
MKRFTTLLLAMAATAGSMMAQTILSEDFETGNTGNALRPVAAGPGWTVIDGYSGSKATYNWHNYYANSESDAGATISGNGCASVDAPFVYGDGDGVGPREEILLSPELDLNDNYTLKFTFRVSPVNAYENSRYDIQVRVVENDNLAGAETIFSIQNEKMLRESGITVFPITNWNPYTANVDLSDFKGSKVKLAFVYKMMGETANVVWLDDITVSKSAPITGPVASASLDRYDYGELYIGEKLYTEPIVLTNTGKDGLKITGLDLPQGVAINIDPTKVNLDRYRSTTFQLSYTASLTSPAKGTAIIHTNGGDLSVELSATKQFVPAGQTLESFEGYFPPAGWTNKGWSGTTQAFEGDQSAYCDGDFSNCTLRSPRLDLTDGGTLTFTYYNLFDDEDVPYFDIELQLSTDGGDSWVTKWVSDFQNGLNQKLTQTIDLGLGTDDSYVRWVYPAVESDDEGALPHSSFYLDRVLLPTIYGAGGVPAQVKPTAPANGTEGVYPKDVELSWTPAQFADGYKLYVGANAEANDLINGLDLGKGLSYIIPEVACETTYRWKVVAYNDKGNANATTWRFTTQPDASVKNYPYEENFTSKELPNGWHSTPSAQYNRTWSVNDLYPYKNDGKTYGAMMTIWLNAGNWNSLETPEFILPDDRPMAISYIWGDGHPSDLVVDPSGAAKKNNVDPHNGVALNTFEIYANGEWTVLSSLSEPKADKKYWINEKIDLSPWKGQKVQFRWKHESFSGSDNGASLTHVTLDVNNELDGCLNKSSWAAGKVNYNKSADSGNMFTVINLGSKPMTVNSAEFATSNFTTSLKAGDVVAPGEVLPFSVRFDALDNPGEKEDNLIVTFDGGLELTMAVSGEALPEDVLYYSFEPNTLDHQWTEDFTMIDKDRANGYSFSTYWIHYSADGSKCAFSCESDSKEDGMYGMMKPVSGMHCLVASSGQSTNADNWIISKKFRAGANTNFEFYGRNWETLNSVLPDPKHNVEVLVSTGSNSDTSEFTSVMRGAEMPFLGDGEWNHYTVDLSKYAGQDIHVALRHYTVSPSNLAFFDDFRINGIDTDQSAVDTVIAATDNVEVYTIAGVKVTEGPASDVIASLAKGLYIVRANGKAMRIMK